MSLPKKSLHSLFALLSLSACSALVSANDNGDYQELLALMEEQTEIATKTRLNADYVPGLVSVLHGTELIERGARTVWEALALVPGIALSIEETGRKQVVVRGIGGTYASGNVKLLVNSVSQNVAQNGLADPVLNMPLQQVERIEVVRGPGSAVHGEYALAGVVNVVTRSGEKSLFSAVESNNGYTIGGNYTNQKSGSEWRMNINAAASETDGPDVRAGEDFLYPGAASISNAPGKTNEKAAYHSLLIDGAYEDFSFKLQRLHNSFGDHFGINYELPPDEKRLVTHYDFTTAELSQALHVTGSSKSTIKVGWQQSEEQKDDLYVDPAEFWGVAGDPDIILDSKYREERLYGSVDLLWREIDKHTVFAEFSASNIRVKQAWMKLNLDPTTYLPSYAMHDYDYLIAKETARQVRSITLQDEYTGLDAVTITAGVRHDSYSDVGNSLNPRLAAVWQLDRRQTLKAQYAKAFRPTSFYELGGSITGIDPAKIHTTELAYIYRTPELMARAVVFDSDIDNLVVFVDDGGWVGFDTIKAESRGVELELEKQLSRKLKLSGDLSYLDTEDASTGKALAFSSDWLANFSAAYRFVPNLTGNLQIRYVGKRNRQVDDTRSELAAYSTVDTTLSYSGFASGMVMRAGIKNLFDKEVRYPAPMNTYSHDFPRAGREWWLELSYKF